MSAYYNENDKNAAAWLRELIKQNLIAPGDVDERSIKDVRADDLSGYTQCHFFAGIGVWSYALRRAGWSDDKSVWTGSCPCQPFSSAGKQRGVDDERHLWPEFYRLIKECRPSIVFGEQVASKDGLAWLDTVQADMEASNYATAAADLCAASIGAPHIRQRLWFVAKRLGDSRSERLEGLPRHDSVTQRETEGRSTAETSVSSGMAHSTNETHGFWSNPDWLYCGDNKWRPVEPGTSPLANGTPARVVRLRGYGNAINAEVATVFIESAQEALEVLKQ